MNNKKSWRRITMATVAFFAITAWGIFCVEKGLDIEWFKTYATTVMLLGFFGIGAIAATDFIDRVKK